MARTVEGVGWCAALAAAGTGAIAAAIAIAPSYTRGDMWDSGLFYPSFLVLGVLAGAAAYRVPRLWLAFGVSAMAPYYIWQIFGPHGEAPSFWMLGLIFLVPLTVIPVAGALLGSVLRERVDQRRGS